MPLLFPHHQRTVQQLHCPLETSTGGSLSSFPLHMSRCTLSTLSKVPKRGKFVCCTRPLLSVPPRIPVPLLTSVGRILSSGWSGLPHNCEYKEPTPSIPSKWDTAQCHIPAARPQVQDRRDFPPPWLPRKLSPSAGCHLRRSLCKESTQSSQSKQDTCQCCNPQPLQQVPTSRTPLHYLEYIHGLSSWFPHHMFAYILSTRSTPYRQDTPLRHMVQTSPRAPSSHC